MAKVFYKIECRKRRFRKRILSKNTILFFRNRNRELACLAPSDKNAIICCLSLLIRNTKRRILGTEKPQFLRRNSLREMDAANPLAAGGTAQLTTRKQAHGFPTHAREKKERKAITVFKSLQFLWKSFRQSARCREFGYLSVNMADIPIFLSPSS